MAGDTAHEYARPFIGIEPDNYGVATKNGASMDASEFQEVLIILTVGDMNTAATIDVTIEDSADDSSFAALTSAVFTQKIAGTDDNKIFYGRISTQKARKFLRPVGVSAVTDADYSVQMVGINPKTRPQSDSANVAFNIGEDTAA